MFESFVVTLREGAEAALAVGLIVIALRKAGRQALLPWVFGGLGLAVAGSLAGAWVLTRMPVDEEVFEGTLMIVAAALVGSMIVWMWRTARHLSKDIQAKVESLSAAAMPESASWRAGLGILAFTFVMVFREGVETVVFLGATSLDSEGVATAAGILVGIALSVLFGVAFVRGSLRIDIKKFFAITGIVLLILAAQLLVGGLHEFSEIGLVTFGPREMAIIGPLVKSNALFLAAMLALPFLILLFPQESVRKERERIASISGAERRLALAALRVDQFWRRTAAVLAAGMIATVAGAYAYSSGPKSIDPPLLVEAKDGMVAVPVSVVDDGNLHRFGMTIGSDVIRFLVLKRPDGTFSATFDACAICGAKGYVQEGRRFVCLNCSADINPVSIGRKGGCNPIPLESVRKGNRLLVQVEHLLAERGQFAGGWKPEVVDPVCLMGMRIADAGASENYKGRTYYFCKMPHCRMAFLKEPERYAKAP